MWQEPAALRDFNPGYVAELGLGAMSAQCPDYPCSRFDRVLIHLTLERIASARLEPARLQARKFAVGAQRRERAVDRFAQRLGLFGKCDAELLVGRHLQHDWQFPAILYQ